MKLTPSAAKESSKDKRRAKGAKGHKHASARCGSVDSVLTTRSFDGAGGIGHMHAEIRGPSGTQTSLYCWFSLNGCGRVLGSGHALAVLVVLEVRIESILSIR